MPGVCVCKEMPRISLPLSEPTHQKTAVGNQNWRKCAVYAAFGPSPHFQRKQTLLVDRPGLGFLNGKHPPWSLLHNAMQVTSLTLPLCSQDLLEIPHWAELLKIKVPKRVLWNKPLEKTQKSLFVCSSSKLNKYEEVVHIIVLWQMFLSPRTACPSQEPFTNIQVSVVLI